MKPEMLFLIRDRIGLLIILIAFGFFIPAVYGASLNDACFTGGCHNSTGPTIDRVLYDSNPHKIINCIDCHVNSTDNSSEDHGQFIRQLNGSKITGPLTTQYYSENFSLCYYCHAEKDVVGFLPGWTPSDNHVNLTPIVVSTIGTNFINMDPLGYHNGSHNGTSDIPTNIHWNHLDAFGSTEVGNLGKFDSSMNGSRTSYQSCPACHNVHGTNYPKMTKNDLAITYGNDSNGTFGYIGSDQYLYSGGDIFCSGCHNSGTTFKYYRNEIDIFEDCVSCHVDNVNNVPEMSIVNATAFGQAEHVNINTTGGEGVVNNSDCWTCHFDREMNRSTITRCEDCHTGSGAQQAPTAPKITSHLSDKVNYSCSDCHSKVIVDPGFGSTNITSHYLSRPTVTTEDYCNYCHGPNATSPFQAVNKTIPDFTHDDPLWNGNTTTCRTCHSNSNVTADPLANDTSSFHDLTTELGDVFNGTIKADCILCHIQKDPQFVAAVDLPPLHPDTSGMVADDCYGCHGVGATQPQKIHSVEPGCIACHSNSSSRYYANTTLFGKHANTDTTDGLNNISDKDCEACHFGSANDSMPMTLGAANYDNTYFCEDCHTSVGRNPSQYNNMSEDLRKEQMTPESGHGMNNCLDCHIPGYDKPRPLTDKVRYHTHGPKGFVE